MPAPCRHMRRRNPSPLFTRDSPRQEPRAASEACRNVRTIRTERLRLVPVTPANAGMLWEVLQEPDLRDYQDLPDVDRAQFLRVVSSATETLRSRSDAGASNGSCITSQGDERAARAGSRCASREHDRTSAEIGYSVVRAYRGRGIATEAVAALVDEGFTPRTAARDSRLLPTREPLVARRACVATVSRATARCRAARPCKGRPVDVIVHTLERERWAAAPHAEPGGHSIVIPASWKPA